MTIGNENSQVNQGQAGGTSPRGSVLNNGIFGKEEERLANYLKEKNLKRTNDISAMPKPKHSFYSRYGKRILDLVIAIPCFIILCPIYLVLSLGVLIDVGSPIIYRQTRCGMDCQPFNLLKFRSMNNRKDANGELLPAKDRVTGFGKIIRKYSLDELLGFWNIIKGDMSIIGPRPMPMFYIDRMSERHKMRHAVRPGLECPRVYVPEGENLCQYHKQFENDVWYVEHVSFGTDLRMCFMLVRMVFEMKVRGKRATGNAASFFVGYDEEGHAMSMNTASQLYTGI